MTEWPNDTAKVPPGEPFLLAWVGPLLPAERRAEVPSWDTWLRHLWTEYESDKAPSPWRKGSARGLGSGAFRAPFGEPPSDFLSAEDLQGFLVAGEAIAAHRKPMGGLDNRSGSMDADVTKEEGIPSSPEAALRQAFLPSCRIIASKLGFTGTWRHESVDGVVLTLIGLHGIRRLLLDEHPISPFSNPGEGPFKKPSESERDRLLWRQCVMIRQHLANAVPLSLDMRPLNRRRFKIWWFAALEWTRLAEHAHESFLASGFVLPLRSRIQIQWQALFSRTTFR